MVRKKIAIDPLVFYYWNVIETDSCSFFYRVSVSFFGISYANETGHVWRYWWRSIHGKKGTVDDVSD